VPETPLESASWAHRLVALMVDWIASSLVVVVLLGPRGWSESAYAGLYVLAVFALENAVFTSLVGGSFGQMATRIRVVRVDGSLRPIAPLQALLRSVLICLVIPPLVFKPDGRGLHDLVAGSQTVALKDYLAAMQQR
jgi:uncharacterized RDD family membrane protein YckC